MLMLNFLDQKLDIVITRKCATYKPVIF